MNFTINDIPESIAASMRSKAVWTPECPVPIEHLKLIEISHYDFAGDIKEGQMIVLDKISESVIKIFTELFARSLQVHSIKLMDEFNGDDNLSMAANNSSSFNFRKIEGSTLLSMHSYGLAIDINPVQNPFIMIDEDTHNVRVLPKKSSMFLNRSNQRAGMAEPIIEIFKKHGLSVWGGNWNNPIDYHHFQVPREDVAELMIGIS
ncbi:MAG: hypothetical protein COA94_04640 [Rickettsiales bacterium]|nr:MAG: hypothetical protein COA94_04640 [Rickettsiales bacterium]